MPHGIFCHIYALQEYTHVSNEMSVFGFLKYSICCEVLILNFQVTQSPFVCIFLHVLQKLDQWNTYNMLFIINIGIRHEQCNIIHCGKHENILLNMCLFHMYLRPDEVYLYWAFVTKA